MRALINRHLNSVVDLECLLLVASEPDRLWQSADLTQSLYISDVAARTQLKKLVLQGFLHDRGEGRFQYNAPAEFAEAMTELANAYDKWRVRVIEYIYSRPAESVSGFARAFKIKGDKDE